MQVHGCTALWSASQASGRAETAANGSNAVDTFEAFARYLDSTAPWDRKVIDAHRQRCLASGGSEVLDACFVGGRDDKALLQALFRLRVASHPNAVDYLAATGECGTIGDDALLALRALRAESRAALLHKIELTPHGLMVLPVPGSAARILLHPECLSEKDGAFTAEEACTLLLSKGHAVGPEPETCLKRMLCVRLAKQPRRPDPLALRTWCSTLLKAHEPFFERAEVTRQDMQDFELVMRWLADVDPLEGSGASCRQIAARALARSTDLN
ncbi:hypothetical protein [Pandoraea sp. ISTKB]|uniref:hypothetical protein n=1 Tax=Pandoraea sp. ISTKB TaxID=1586708 RepID=UPI000846780A|nr:hypothetical protein [Pandoraea sp. ISTKB]ODP35573.1 hypothetical protein A9762_00765 [Pandoraea sp. ISTKB]